MQLFKVPLRRHHVKVALNAVHVKTVHVSKLTALDIIFTNFYDDILR